MGLPSIIKTDRDKFLALVFVVILFTSITLYPCLKNGFLNFDDLKYVSYNLHIQEISCANTKAFFTSSYFSNYTPITLMSYAVDYHIGKLKPLVYHTTNLLFHLLNCILVFWLIYLLSRSISVAFLVALLFGIHPLHVESVAWVSERKDVLYSFFFLSSLIIYIKYYALSLLLFLASCLSKSMAVTLPLVLFLIDYLLHHKLEIKTFLFKIPFISISLAFGFIAILTQYGHSYTRPSHLFSFLDNILRASYGLVFYICKIIVPVHLSGLYPNPQIVGGNYPVTFLLAPFAIILLILIIILLRNNKRVIFGTVFFLLTILPVLQLLPIGTAIAADRYTYIPAIGMFYLFGEGCSWFYKEKLTKKTNIRTVFFSCLIVIIATFSFLSWQRCHVWKDSITFWTDVISKYPNSLKAYDSRGIAYAANGDDKRAIEDFKKAWSLNPYNPMVLNNLFATYRRLGMNNVAIFVYTTASEQNPDIIKVLLNLGRMHLDTELFNDAIDLYTTLQYIVPQETLRHIEGEIFNNLAIAHFRKKEYGFAEYYGNKAVNTGYKIAPEIQTLLKTKER
jgi:hypothetical protein